MTLLTIDGQTQCVKAWSRVPGAAKYITIIHRLRRGEDHRTAVFAGDRRGLSQGPDRAKYRKLMRKPYKPAQRFEVGILPAWGSVQSVTFCGIGVDNRGI